MLPRHRSNDDSPTDDAGSDTYCIVHAAATRESYNASQLDDACTGRCPEHDVVTNSRGAQWLKNQNLDRFMYEPLADSSTSIRLLVLEPGTWDISIRCELRMVSLNTNPSYDALSYVWGDVNDRRSIELCGFDHQVTVNLEVALRHLRREDQPRILWVDALCINQADLEERGKQVLLMNWIYKQATTVISWVGEASEDSGEAIKFIRELGLFMIENEDDLELSAESVESLGFPLKSQNWPALWKFLWRDYWTRMWIIQELAVRGVLTNASGVILCGSASVARVCFDMSCSLILAMVVLGKALRDDGLQLTEPLRSMLELGHPPAIIMCQTLCACNIGPQAKILTHLLNVTRRFRASDPRDKIYALVGLCDEADRTFPVDYTKGNRDVLKDVVKFLVDKDKKLTILYGNRNRPNPSGPSWAPDLDDGGHDQSYILWSAGTIKASGETEAFVEFSSQDEILAALGVVAGELRQVIGPMQQVSRVEPKSDLLSVASAAGLAELFQQLVRLYSELSEADREVFWRTLVTDCDRSDMEEVYPAPEEFGAMFRVAVGLESPPESFRLDLPEVQRRQQFAMPFLANLQKVLSERCFFTTTCGLMGIGPYCTKAGDIAVVLYGSDYIMILRSIGGQFQLIGDAYVHGIMHGELLRDRLGEDTQFFELC